MEYTIAAHPTVYRGVTLRSRLEARWAAFFDLAGWKWQYEPIDLPGWAPDFLVCFPCAHSECQPAHRILVEVKPYFSLAEFKGHPCLDYPYGHKLSADQNNSESIPADASAAFGNNPDVTYWEMCHGAGGGVYSVQSGWIDIDPWGLWNLAARAVQYLPVINREALDAKN